VKTLRTDLAALAALALVVAAVVVLTVTHQVVPDWLQALGATLAAAYVGFASPTRVQLGSPATEPAALVDEAPPVPAHVPGRDMTESFPAITQAQIDAFARDRAGQP
jgi:uncharacterized SAM-binding protein YcdF (DUF218 family)